MGNFRTLLQETFFPKTFLAVTKGYMGTRGTRDKGVKGYWDTRSIRGKGVVHVHNDAMSTNTESVLSTRIPFEFKTGIIRTPICLLLKRYGKLELYILMFIFEEPLV